MSQYILDKHKKNWIRFGTNINQFTAMCVWDGMLVFGVGNTGSYPNLVYANWDVVTEVGSEFDGDYVDQTITYTWRTKSLDFGFPDVDKQIDCIDVVYQDHRDWNGETIQVQYCIDRAGVGAIPTFTNIGTITLGAVGSDYQTLTATIPFAGLSNVGRFFEFQFTGTEHLRINKLIIYYHIHSKKYG